MKCLPAKQNIRLKHSAGLARLNKGLYIKFLEYLNGLQPIWRKTTLKQGL